MTPEHEKNLERFADRVLRDLPARSAPRSLEARVQAEIARRAALPWWRKSFAYWPMTVRAAFVLVSAVFVKVVTMVPGWLQVGSDVDRVKTALAPQVHSLQTMEALFASLAGFSRTMLNSIPPLWLYGGVTIVVALYIALFGLGAAAYRTLYASR